MNTILILSLVLVSIHVPYGQSATKTNFHDEYDGILPRFVSDEYDCEKYKLLVRSEWVEYNCPTSMKWNQSLSLCVNYNAAEERCSSIYETSGNIDLPSGQITSPFKKEDATNLEEVDPCVNREDYFLIALLECKQFTICENGNIQTYACPEGLLYSSKFRRCVNAKDSECNKINHDIQSDIDLKQVAKSFKEQSELGFTNVEQESLPPARYETCSSSIADSCKKIILCDDLEPQKLGKKHQLSGFFNVIERFAKRNEGTIKSSEPVDGQRNVPKNRKHVGSKVPILGSKNSKVREAAGDFGFFTAVYEAYNNHWALRTTPEDWWFTIIRTVALAIDDNSNSPKVRSFFVNHDGKKELRVNVAPGTLPHDVDYSNFFDQMTNLIDQNINVTGYVDAIRSDFSTSSKVHKIISEITVMSSTQEFFDFTGGTFCGIPRVEMLGTLKDWQNLKRKILNLKEVLLTIIEDIYLIDYFENLPIICDKLIETYSGTSLNTTSEWWSHIFSKEERFGSGGGTFYNGWFIEQFLNLESVRSFGAVPTGLVTVPMKLKELQHEENSTLVAGIAGVTIDQTPGGVPIVQANHGWAMFVEPDSIYNDRDD